MIIPPADMLLCATTLILLLKFVGLTSATSSRFSSKTSLLKVSDFDDPSSVSSLAEIRLGLSRQKDGSFNVIDFLSSPSLVVSTQPSSLSKLSMKRSSKTPVYILVLLPKSTNFLFSIQWVSPAIALATDNVTSSQFLKRHRLVTLYADSKCHIAEAMNEAVTFYMKGKVHAFLGPVCDYSMAPVARQAKYWNLPVITSGAMARDFGASRHTLYNTLTRVGSSYSTLIEFLAVMFRHYGYSKVNLVYEPNGQGHILDKLCYVMTDGIHYAFTHDGYNIRNVASKCQVKADMEDILKDKIGVKFGERRVCLTEKQQIGRIWEVDTHAAFISWNKTTVKRLQEEQPGLSPRVYSYPAKKKRRKKKKNNL